MLLFEKSPLWWSCTRIYSEFNILRDGGIWSQYRPTHAIRLSHRNLQLCAQHLVLWLIRIDLIVERNDCRVPLPWIECEFNCELTRLEHYVQGRLVNLFGEDSENTSLLSLIKVFSALDCLGRFLRFDWRWRCLESMSWCCTTGDFEKSIVISLKILGEYSSNSRTFLLQQEYPLLPSWKIGTLMLSMDWSDIRTLDERRISLVHHHLVKLRPTHTLRCSLYEYTLCPSQSVLMDHLVPKVRAQ